MISLDAVTCLFGPAQRQGLCAARQGAGRARIRDALGTTLALHDVSFSIGEGELFVVMGLSGSGKSTLVRLINGLIKPDAGSVAVMGHDVSAMPPKDLATFRRQRIAMVFQSFALFPHLSVGANVSFGLKMTGRPRDECAGQAEHWLSRVGLDGYADANPADLSGGMRQRVGLARALAVDAPVMLMDEPFSALDPVTRADLQALLLDLQAELARTIVFETHDFAEATRLATRIAVLDEGTLAQVGTPDEIRHAPASPYVARFVASATSSAD